jgi:mRNA interferase RelE/StbE
VKYKVFVSAAAKKYILRLPRRDYEALQQALTVLSDNPRPDNSLNLAGSDLLRIRVRRYRIIYGIDHNDRLVYVERIALRNEKTYRNL